MALTSRLARPGNRNAESEAYLDRRLAVDVYLGAVPLTLTDGRGLAIGGDGVAVDWLVNMVRPPPSGCWTAVCPQ